jgi:DNA-binding HxlR family transcriptional regulator
MILSGRFDFQSLAIRFPKHKHMPSKHPINDLLELLGRRWMLRVLWELRDGPLPFRRLREACDELSTSVLSQRLRELRDEQLVALDAAGAYALTADGRALGEQLIALDAWARRRARRQGG